MSIKRMGLMMDTIVLGYELCGSSVGAIERVINEAPIPVAIPRDEKGEILNNCIEIALGRERVQALLKEEVGTFHDPCWGGTHKGATSNFRILYQYHSRKDRQTCGS